METQTTSRTVRPDAETVKRLRLGKGWRVEDLAKHAKCSTKTIENVERGASVYMFTLAKLAKELGVEFMTLVQGGKPPPEPPKLVSGDEQPPEPQKKQGRFRVQITADIPFEDFDESDQLVSFITLVKQIVQAKAEIVVAGVEPGSTIITLEMNINDIERLLFAFTGGHNREELDALRVAQLKLPDSEDFTLTQTEEDLENESIETKPLRGSVFTRRLPKPVPQSPPMPQSPMPHLPDDKALQKLIDAGLVEPPIPERTPADTDTEK